MSDPSGNGLRREREWLIWGFRGLVCLLSAIAVALIGWNLSYTVKISEAVGVHEARLDGHQAAIIDLQTWRYSFERRR